MNKRKKIIFFELNEVPLKVFKESFDYLNYKVKIEEYEFIQTISRDECHLSPWITWPTVHRGATFSKHQIGDLGQNCDDADKKYPPIWSILKNQGLKVGVFGSLHSSHINPDAYKEYSFFVPDVFSAHEKCHPKKYSAVQSINLYLSRRSARIVEKKFFPPIGRATRAIYSYLLNCFSFNTFLSICNQLVMEIISPWKNIRRRTIQSDILFDGFFSFLKHTKPDFSTFFTNHVASSMHRFWEATYPNDFKKLTQNKSWLERYRNEIPLAMKSTCRYINKLTEFVDKNPDYELWILSSMGQVAQEGYKPQKQFWSISNLKTFIENILGEHAEIEVGPSMVPLYSFNAHEKIIQKTSKILKQISTNVSIEIRTQTKNSLSFYFYSNQNNIYIKKDNFDLKLEGLTLIEIKENTSSAAYHVPEGIFFKYSKQASKIDEKFLINDFLPTDKIFNMIIDNFK